MFHPDLGHQAVINGGSSSMLQYGHESRFPSAYGFHNQPFPIPPQPPPFTLPTTHPPPDPCYFIPPQPPYVLPQSHPPPKPPYIYPSTPCFNAHNPQLEPNPHHYPPSSLTPFTDIVKQYSFVQHPPSTPPPTPPQPPPNPTLPPQLQTIIDDKLEAISSSFRPDLKAVMEGFLDRVSTLRPPDPQPPPWKMAPPAVSEEAEQPPS